MDERKIEEQIQEKGLTAPRVTPDDIDNAVADVQFHVFPGTTVTVCCVQLKNGFCVVGKSAAASPENFNSEIGREIAFNRAREEIWSYLGFDLCQRIFLAKQLHADGVSLTSQTEARGPGDPE